MSLLSTSLDLDACRLFSEELGYVPDHVRSLSLIPRLVEAEGAMSSVILFRDSALTRMQKEWMLFALAAARNDSYGLAQHYQALLGAGALPEQLQRVRVDYRKAGLAGCDIALIEFALNLGRLPTVVSTDQMNSLRQWGLGDAQILETVLTACWSAYLHIIGTGLLASPCLDLPPLPTDVTRSTVIPDSNRTVPSIGERPHVRIFENDADSCPLFSRITEHFGYIPNVFRAEALRPDVIEAQLHAADLWLFTEDFLTRMQKEAVFLAVAAANLNSYCVAMHCEILRQMGIPEEEAGRIAIDHHSANLPETDKLLLDACLKLSRTPATFDRTDIEALRSAGFAREQITETVVITAIAHMFNTLDTGLGVEPDFKVGIRLKTQAAVRQAADATAHEDPDVAFVAKVQAGDTAAFEELVRRHGRRVYRTIAAILGNEADLDDAVQDSFVKAFQHIGEFQGRSLFATWLTRIAVNCGLQRIRARRHVVSLDDGSQFDGDFVPRQVEAWQDNPEQTYSRTETHALVMEAVMQLPEHYRIVVMLRDIQEFSAEEAAASLGLTVANVKSRLFRGRLMVREALSPHFTRKDVGRNSC